MAPTFFATQEDFYTWLDTHYKTETELLVGFYKTGSGRPSMTWPQSVDQALCFGWIDGVRRSLGEEAYTIRFTPRKPKSIWSTVNIDKMELLIKQNRVKPEGLAAYKKRTLSRSSVYSHERKEAAILPYTFEAEFKQHVPAWEFFMSQPPGYQKVMLHWITMAKQEKTQEARFKKLLAACIDKKRIT